ncbi:unnamed protein product [Paramecium sonneborni]|uniref:Uncharacterized protein n=1 Tax=Paramecium sonneborni TaxID=65129 RepID=A0A8S1LAX5_9CILI|nr:unnamed protein product [Paramecium sonneborni]
MKNNQSENIDQESNLQNKSQLIKSLVKQIMQESSKIHKQKSNIKRSKWNQESLELFQKLYHNFLGDLNMIHSYFQQHTEFKFTKKQIKKQFSQQINYLFKSNYKSMDEEIYAKYCDTQQYIPSQDNYSEDQEKSVTSSIIFHSSIF